MARDSFHDRLFRALLRLFPFEFRGDFGEQMTADFRDQRRDAGGRPRDVRSLWTRTALDLLRRAPREHLEVLWRDVVHAFRVLRRHPASTATAVLSLAIGVGLNSAVFSLVRGVLWQDLPFAAGDRLVLVGLVDASNDEPSWMSYSGYTAIERQSRMIDPLAAARSRMLTVVEPGEPEYVRCFGVSEEFFAVLGATPIQGRFFSRADYAVSRPQDASQSESPPPSVVALSHEQWRRRFGGERDVAGRRIRLSGGEWAEVVGVMGPEMDALPTAMRAGCWFPAPPEPPGRSFGGFYTVMGRLAPGVSISEAGAELAVIGRNLGSVPSRRPAEPRTLAVASLHDLLVGRVRTQLNFLFGAVVCVLLVTCANVANLFLAHASGRRDELTTRAALGATRARLIRQTLTETLLVSLLGGAGGFLLAVAGVPMLVAMAPADVPRLQQVGVDWSTFAFTAVVSLVVGILAGLLASVPARSLTSAVGSVRVTATPRTNRFRHGLAVAEIALALMLVVGATLMVRTVRALGAVNLGFDPAHVISASLPSFSGAFDLAAAQARDTAIVERVKALPAVRAAGIGLGPLAGGMFIGGLVVPGNPREFDTVRVDAVSPGYFEALGVRLLAGRFFDPRDAVAGRPDVVLVNEAAAQAFWDGADPIGKPVLISKTNQVHVIGVIANLVGSSLEAEPEATIYQLSSQSRNFRATNMLIKVGGDPQALVPAIRSIITSVDPEALFAGVMTLQERINRQMASRLFLLRVIGLFSILGLILAVVGVYGVLAESVAQRVPEIGIRMAVGATASDVLKLILRQGVWLASAGIVLGLAGAVLLRGTMSTIVYGVQTLDPLAFVTAGLFLLAATTAACLLPARHASRLDPVVALRLD